VILPDVIDARPHIVEMRVVLPAPLGPRRAIISPWLIFRLKFLTAIKSLSYFLTKFLTEIISDNSFSLIYINKSLH
jgi:hypothetical protein